MDGPFVKGPETAGKSLFTFEIATQLLSEHQIRSQQWLNFFLDHTTGSLLLLQDSAKRDALLFLLSHTFS